MARDGDSASAGAQAPVLAIRGLTMSFGGVKALDDVSLEIRAGEIHGLLGENGSGKSTLIKTLAGYHAPASGALEVRGVAVELPLRPGQFRALDFEFVHQDLGLVPTMSVTENLFMSKIAEPHRAVHISWRAERRRARKVFERYKVRLDPAAAVGDLNAVERAMLAIVRAVEGVRRGGEHSGAGGPALLVLDEPTVFLPKRGAATLFDLLREIKAAGSSVLFVSHHLDEVLEITDRVTVLRDGRRVATVATNDVTQSDLVEMILGRRLEYTKPREGDRAVGRAAITAEHLSGDVVKDVALELRHGEVVGLTGLVGAGFEEVPYLLFGARDTVVGRLTTERGELDAKAMTPRAAAALGWALVPADRQRDSGVPTLPITDNLLVGQLQDYYQSFFLRRKRMERAAAEVMTRFDVRPRDPRVPLASLSGGNQQKVVMAKWLDSNPSVLLLHEPTQGVDVGSRLQVFGLIRETAQRGAAVLCASADHEQLAAICDRVLIMNRGVLTAEIGGADITEERISAHCYA